MSLGVNVASFVSKEWSIGNSRPVLSAGGLINSSLLVAHAIKIEDYRATNPLKFVVSILENMGFEDRTNSYVTHLLSNLHERQINTSSIPKTSGLGRVIREFIHRQKAFFHIAQDSSFTLETFMSDIAFPLSIKLRNEAEEQALCVLQREKSEAVCPSKDKNSSVGIFHSLFSTAWSCYQYFSKKLDYLNTQVLVFPGVSGEIVESDVESSRSMRMHKEFFPDNFSKEDSDKLKGLVKNSISITENEVKSAQDKKVIFVMGYTGAGKGVFINYLFSSACSCGPEEITCDRMMVDTAGGRYSDTKYIRVLKADGELEKTLGDGVVIVDTPGFNDRRETYLESLVYSLFTSKSIYELSLQNKEYPISSIYIIDYKSFESKTPTIADLGNVIKQNGAPKALIVSKVPLKNYFELERRPVIVQASKTGIQNALNSERYPKSLVEDVALYDVEDAELALSCAIVDRKYKCDGGGGANRFQIIKKLESLLSAAQPFEARQIIDPQLREYVDDLKNELIGELEKAFGTNAKSCNFEKINKKYGHFRTLIGIGHLEITNLDSLISAEVEKKINSIVTNTELISRDLISESKTKVEAIKANIEWIEKFKKIDGFYDITIIEKKRVKLILSILQECSANIDLILRDESQWQSPSNIEHIFELISHLKLKVQFDSKIEEIYEKMRKVIKEYKQAYYKALENCDFDTTNSQYEKIKKLEKFLLDVKSPIRSEDIKKCVALQEKYDDLVNYEYWKTAGLGVGGAAMLIGTWYISGPALLAVNTAMALEGFAALEASAKVLAIAKAITAAEGGLLFVASGASSTVATVGSLEAGANYLKLTDVICQDAWRDENVKNDLGCLKHETSIAKNLI